MAELGLDELDTARVYGAGQSEAALGAALGPLRSAVTCPFVATKVAPPLGYAATSLVALQADCVDLFYLHSPDPDATIEETLRAVDEGHNAGKFNEFGLSNFTAGQVEQIVSHCRKHGIVQPTVFQGSYHVLQRHQTEQELLPVLRAHGIRFLAYSPLAGGLLTGKHHFGDVPTEGRYEGGAASRWGERWWKEELFLAIGELQSECETHGVTLAAAAIRWAVIHSALGPEHGDAVILGASSVAQLASNAEHSRAGPLPPQLVEFMDALADSPRVRGAVPPISSKRMCAGPS